MNPDLFFENKKFISTKKASDLSGYSKDYVGQLCRQGELECKKIGRVWYVTEDSILNHKNPLKSDFFPCSFYTCTHSWMLSMWYL